MKTNPNGSLRDKKETRSAEEFQHDFEAIRNSPFLSNMHRGVTPIHLHNAGNQNQGMWGNMPFTPFNFGFPSFYPSFGVQPFSPFANPFQSVNAGGSQQSTHNGNGSFFGAMEFSPLVNVSEDDENYFIELVVPGYRNEDCKVKVKDRVLYVYGTREQNREEVFYTLKEYRNTYFERSFLLSDEIDSEEIGATCSHGILKLTLNKKSEEARQEKEIEVTEEVLA